MCWPVTDGKGWRLGLLRPLLFLSFPPSLVQRCPHDTTTYGAVREESAWAAAVRASRSNHSLLMPPANTPASAY